MHAAPFFEILYRTDFLVQNQYNGPDEFLVVFFMDFFIFTLQIALLIDLIRVDNVQPNKAI
jgi:hypothetical protein